ncbi:MAG: PAS domain-containing protein [Candidatus Lokiarchaeota archaeon]|nr:PAS domain-containing protein [Candidatus Lokiarchaeota archaeon]
MEKEKSDLESTYKIIVDNFTLPILVIQLHREDNSNTIRYFNFKFQELSKDYIIFPKIDIACGDRFPFFKVSSISKLRRLEVILEGLKKVFQEKPGYSLPITTSLIKRFKNGIQSDVAALENIANQIPYQLTVIKLTEDMVAVIYEKIQVIGNAFSLNLNNIVSLGATQQGAFILKDDVINYANAQFIEMLDYDKPNEIIDKPIKEFITKSDYEGFTMQLEDLKESESFETTCRFVKKDGSLIWMRLSCGIFNLGKRFGNSVVCDVVDITEQKRTELTLFQTHRMASIGELASGVAHEINNPLFGIMNYAGLIKDTVDEGGNITKDSEEYEFLTGIIEESERIAEITNNLSEFSRNVEDRDYVETDIEELIQKVENVLRHQLKRSHVTIEKNITKDFPKYLMLQKNRIRTTLFNIILNSIQAVEPVKDRDHIIKINLSTKQYNGNTDAIIKIHDNGIGIEDDKLVKVFDPFYTSNRCKKTGLGLHTVYQIIKEHDGDIHINSKFGQWTEITISLPIKPRENKK